MTCTLSRMNSDTSHQHVYMLRIKKTIDTDIHGSKEIHICRFLSRRRGIFLGLSGTLSTIEKFGGGASVSSDSPVLTSLGGNDVYEPNLLTKCIKSTRLPSK